MCVLSNMAASTVFLILVALLCLQPIDMFTQKSILRTFSMISQSTAPTPTQAAVKDLRGEIDNLQSALNVLQEKYKNLQMVSTTQQTVPLTTFQTTKPTPSQTEVEIANLRAEIVNMQTELRDLQAKFKDMHSSRNLQGTNPFVAFEARLSNSLMGLGPNQIVLFDKVLMNKGNGYDSRIGVFRCPVNGTYQLFLSVACFGRTQLEIVNNGAQVAHLAASQSRVRMPVVLRSADKRQIPTMAASTTMLTPESKHFAMSPHGSEAGTASIQFLLDLVVGDDIWVRHVDNGMSSVVLSDTYTTFSGHIVHAY
ncbi:uncharacterized protein LOC121392250 [Gigantopelta aegis]|uniref:uncharacterized protein LOC121392250 n=1 Tax=Gigantopelta aegis TaxID=1735272 RepID=UPI001B88C8D3|nr:uncharacterized protein LOC121392250 [Gigantopelta aegis]